MEKLSVVIVGLGERGKIHLHGFLKNHDAFLVKGVCDRKQQHLTEAIDEYGIDKDKCCLLYTSRCV